MSDSVAQYAAALAALRQTQQNIRRIADVFDRMPAGSGADYSPQVVVEAQRLLNQYIVFKKLMRDALKDLPDEA
jgi:DNA-binding FadR family transcriptional regulator